MYRDPINQEIVMYSQEDEISRIQELESLHIVDSKPEESFDRITRLVARLFDIPICLISLVTEDKQWFKSCVGLDVTDTEREAAFCQYVVALKETVIVEDTLKDDRFRNNRLVNSPGIRFYAGAKLVTANNQILGSLCVIDTKPRQFTKEDKELLEDLAEWVITEIELRRTLQTQRKEQKELEQNIQWASNLQKELLPPNISHPLVKMKSIYFPSEIVSGDCFNYQWDSPTKLSGYIVDVMGHGIPTALQVSAIRVLFSQAMERSGSLKSKIEWINEASFPFMPEGYYFTAIYFEIDFEKYELNCVCAGINRFHLRDQEEIIRGTMLGIFKNATFNEKTFKLNRGDRIVFYSDGFSETYQLTPDEKPLEVVVEVAREEFSELKIKDDATALFFEIL